MMTTKHGPRLDMPSIAPRTYAAMQELGKSYADVGLDPALCELLKIRASQINGCAFCLDMHIQVARKLDISDDTIHMVAVWREAPQFTDAERAAFALCEAVTLIADGGVGDDLYRQVREHYDEKQFLGLLTAINVINAWNRFMVAVAAVPPHRERQRQQ